MGPAVRDRQPRRGGRHHRRGDRREADPDGYTILYDATAFSINPFLYGKLSFDYRKDFQPVILTTLVPNILVLNKDVPAKTVADVIAMAKAAPDGLDFASSGNGTVQHLSLEMFRHMTGTKINHIPYRGGGPALNDVMGGQVKFFFSNGSASVGLVQAGSVKGIAHTGKGRLATLPDLPPVSDTIPGFEAYEWNGVFVPTGTPAEIIQKLNAGLNALMKDTGRDRAARQAQHQLPAEHAGGIPRLRRGRDGALGPHREGSEHQARVSPPLIGPTPRLARRERQVRMLTVRSVLLRVLFAAVLTVPGMPASAEVRILASPGRTRRPIPAKCSSRCAQSGERVVIDGPCLSACTLVLMSLPRSRICVTTTRRPRLSCRNLARFSRAEGVRAGSDRCRARRLSASRAAVDCPPWGLEFAPAAAAR